MLQSRLPQAHHCTAQRHKSHRLHRRRRTYSAASPGGKRYDPSLTSEQRSSEDNGIWLCQNDAKLVDNDEIRYTVALLRERKQKAEAAALAEVEGTAPKRPEDAAELVLSVGGVVVDLAPVKPAKMHWNSSGYCYRHDYEMAVTVRNSATSALVDTMSM